MKRTKGGLEIDLPRVVTFDEILNEITQLPISYVNRDGFIGYAELRLPSEVTEIRIRTDAVASMTSEAAATVLALEAWLQRRVGQVSLICDLGTTLTRLKKASAKSRDGFFYSSLLEVPRIEQLGKPNIDLVKSLEKVAREQAQQVNRSSPTRLSDAEKGWLFEVFLETLLNISEHAGIESVRDQATASAFLAVTLTGNSSAFHGESTSQDLQKHSRSERIWKTGIQSTGASILEVTACDVGQGIPQSLSKSYISVQQERGLSTDASERAILHNDVLAWAISPFGTRKSPEDFLSYEHGNSWRGLYRIAFKTQRLKGLFSVSSGCGRVTVATGPQSTADDVRTESDRGLPWTAVRAAIPIDLPAQSEPKDRLSIPQNQLEIAEMAIVTPIAGIDLLDSQTIETYSDSVFRAIRSNAKFEPQSEGNAGTRYIAVVHPSIPYLHPRPFKPTHLLGVDEPAAPVPQLIWRIFQPLMLPGLSFVHLFLDGDISEGSLAEAQQYIYSKVENMPRAAQRANFGLHAIYIAKTDRLVWLHSVRPPSGRVEVATLSSTIGTLADELWQRYLRSIGPEATPQLLPLRLSPRTVSRALQAILPILTARAHQKSDELGRKWYWRAEKDGTGSPREGIQVSSNRIAFEYLNTCALCESTPAVFYVLRNDFFEYLRIKLQSGITSIVVVPDTEILSRFLVSRLEQEWREFITDQVGQGWSGGSVAFSSLEDLGLRYKATDHVVVFADFALSGESLARRLHVLEKWGGISREKNVHAYIFIRGGRLTAALGGIKAPQVLVDYPIDSRPRHAEETIALLAIDPVSNDLIPHKQTVALGRYASFHCSAESSVEADFCTDSSFEYGIRFVSSRYFVCRWPVSKNLSNPVVRKRLLEQLLGSIKSQVESGSQSIVVLARQDSTLISHFGAIAADLSDQIRTGESYGIDSSNVSVGVIVDRRYEPRRLSARTILNAIVDSSPLSGEAQQFDHGLAGISLQPRNFLQLTLEGFDALPSRLGANLRSRRLGVLFLDNAAVSGKTVFELIHAVSQLHSEGAINAAALHVHCIVTRLSPIEESVLQQLSLDFRKEPKSRSSPIPFRFSPLVQLRIRSYRTPDEMRAIQIAKRALAASKYDDDPRILEIKAQLTQTIAALEDQSARAVETGKPVTSLFGSLIRSGNPDLHARGIVELRQLLSLMQQGIPCTQEIVDSFRALIGLDPIGLLILFGLEPELLEEDVIRSRLAFELESLCQSLINDHQELPVVASALWILANLRESSDLGLARLLTLHSIAEFGFAYFVFLILYVLPEPRRAIVIQNSIRTLSASPVKAGYPVETALKNLRGTLLFEFRGATGERGLDPRRTLEDYIVQARSRHGTRGHAAWIRIRDWRIASGKLNSLGQKHGVTSDPINRVIVDQSELWLKQGLIPALLACCALGSRSERLARQADEMRRAVANLARLFALFHRISLRDPGEGIVDEEVMRLWSQIEDQSTRSASDALFGNPLNYGYLHLGVRGQSFQSPEREFTNFDILLAEFIVEPLFLVLGRVAYTLPQDCGLVYRHFEIDGTQREARVTLVADLHANGLLSHRWFMREAIVTLWLDAIPALDEAMDILLNNIKSYGQISRGVELTTRDVEVDGRAMFAVTLQNFIANGRAKGAGHGLKNVAQCLARVGGTCKSDSKEGRHIVTICVPVNLTPLKESER